MCTGLCVDASHVAVAFAHWCCKLLLHIGVARCRCYYCCSCPAVNCLHTWQGQTYSLPPAFPAGLSTSFHFSFVRHFRYNGGNNGGKAPCTRSCLLATFRFPSWLNRFTTHLPPFPYHSQFHAPSPPPTTTTTIPANVATLGLCCNCLLFPNSLHFSICFFRSAESQVGSVNSWDFTVYLTGFTFFPPGLHCSSPFSFRYRHPSLSLPLSCFSVAQFAMHSS